MTDGNTAVSLDLLLFFRLMEEELQRKKEGQGELTSATANYPSKY
jgi:hypothetical protein